MSVRWKKENGVRVWTDKKTKKPEAIPVTLARKGKKGPQKFFFHVVIEDERARRAIYSVTDRMGRVFPMRFRKNAKAGVWVSFDSSGIPTLHSREVLNVLRLAKRSGANYRVHIQAERPGLDGFSEQDGIVFLGKDSRDSEKGNVTPPNTLCPCNANC